MIWGSIGVIWGLFWVEGQGSLPIIGSYNTLLGSFLEGGKGTLVAQIMA